MNRGKSDQRQAPRPRKGGTFPASLGPNRPILAASARGLVEVNLDELKAEGIGQKAYGLLTIPRVWTKPFFVVDDDLIDAKARRGTLEKQIQAARDALSMASGDVMVRSNGVSEGIPERGSLPSLRSKWEQAADTLFRLHNQVAEAPQAPRYWLIQEAVRRQASGHLSNERRVRCENRDWVIEIENEGDHKISQSSLSVRRWRHGRTAAPVPLACPGVKEIKQALRAVASWATGDSRRFLFEWVWDGASIYIVQMDVESPQEGVNPKTLTRGTLAALEPLSLSAFRVAGAQDKNSLLKLTNVALYERFEYKMPPFFVLDASAGLTDLLASGVLPAKLKNDLITLTQRPLVLRTDGVEIPTNKREMLPRSEELRTPEAAERWLVDTFCPKIKDAGLHAEHLAIIGHHFIPSVSAAWALAMPQSRRVLVEALWGIPESLYWYSHDTFEIDTSGANLSVPLDTKTEYSVQKHLRYKGQFIAPDPNGAWVRQLTKPPHDWSPTITSKRVLGEIAHTTRRICENDAKPVVVMWLVDNDSRATAHRAIPWYHSGLEPPSEALQAPRRKWQSSTDLTLRSAGDWQKIKEQAASDKKIERVVVEPTDLELIRNPQFADELGCLSKKYGFVVVLAGGILSHAYHALRRAGAVVECVDPINDTEERAEYNKLVRDRIPSQIREHGENYEVVRLTGDALSVALRRKLVEEAVEALDAGSLNDYLAELADVQEVVRAAVRAHGDDFQALEKIRKIKKKKRGGFDQGLMLRSTVSAHSLIGPPAGAALITDLGQAEGPLIANPGDLPAKALYSRPDHRTLPNANEELRVVQIGIAQLGGSSGSKKFELDLGSEPSPRRLSVELSRERAEIRVVVRVAVTTEGQADERQTKFDFLAE